MPRIIRRITEHITITTWTLTWDEIVSSPPPAQPPRAQIEPAPAPTPVEHQAAETLACDTGEKDRRDP